MRAILMYHSIDASDSVVSVDEPTFRRHARWLGSGAVRAVGIEALLAASPYDEVVAVTFDDGFVSFAACAWPLLRERGLPATLFVVTDRAGATNAWGGRPDPGVPELPLLDWDALGRLAEEGVELASHTRRHPRLDGVEPERLEDEVRGAAETIEARTGRRPAGFAYPYGAIDAPARAVVRRVHRWACTTELRTLAKAEDTHALPRLDAYYLRGAGQLEAWGTPRFHARLGIRRVARGVRSGMRGWERAWLRRKARR